MSVNHNINLSIWRPLKFLQWEDCFLFLSVFSCHWHVWSQLQVSEERLTLSVSMVTLKLQLEITTQRLKKRQLKEKLRRRGISKDLADPDSYHILRQQERRKLTENMDFWNRNICRVLYQCVDMKKVLTFSVFVDIVPKVLVWLCLCYWGCNGWWRQTGVNILKRVSHIWSPLMSVNRLDKGMRNTQSI